MGDIGSISDLVKGMCNSVGVQPQPISSANASCSGSATTSAIDFAAADAALAKLLWLGYPHEQASEAIRVSGSVDPDYVSEYIIRQTEGASEVSEANGGRSNGVKVINDGRSSRPQGAVLRICEPDEESSRPERMVRNGNASRVVSGKGKAPMDEVIAEDGEPDDDRWNVSNADTTLEILVEMGFTLEKVEEAIRKHGITGNILESVSSLANYIVTGLNNLNLDQDRREDNVGQGSDQYALALVPKDDFPHQDLEVFKQVTLMGFDAAKVSRAIAICGEAATADQLVEHIFDASDNVKATPKREAVEDNVISSKLDQLLNMGYSYVNCRRAVDTYGQSSICELCDFLDALGEEENDKDLDTQELLLRNGKSSSDSDDEHVENCKEIYEYPAPIKKRRIGKCTTPRTSKDRKLCVSLGSSTSRNEDLIPRNRTGFGLPGEIVISRTLPPDVARPPYFYFENVENMPTGEWNNIRRHLFNVEPELMDALNFSVCRRPRGYIHNLPVEGRMDILPKPPMTIQELMGSAAKYWPDWDKRIKLNTICTKFATDFVWRQIKDHLQACEKRGYPLEDEKKNIMYWARKWNLVWVRPNKLAPLSPEEVERCLGFDVNHTRVLYSPVDRIKVLGNSFQVNTVAYQLSVLKARYPQGMRVLSLFSGIGGAEVALHKLGIFLKVVVSIEIEEKARCVLDSWWKSTDQKGHLIHDYTDVKQFDSKILLGLLNKYQGFDLVIGGSPCNNLSGNNRSSRVGLQGTESVAFFEFPRILSVVRDFMGAKGEEGPFALSDS